MTEPAKAAMTTAEAIQWLREWDELSQYDLDRVKGDIIATNRMNKRRSVVRYCLTLMETHVLVPREVAKVAQAACVVAQNEFVCSANAWKKKNQPASETACRNHASAYGKAYDDMTTALKEDTHGVTP